jgi:hypothetical protein
MMRDDIFSYVAPKLASPELFTGSNCMAPNNLKEKRIRGRKKRENRVHELTSN